MEASAAAVPDLAGSTFTAGGSFAAVPFVQPAMVGTAGMFSSAVGAIQQGTGMLQQAQSVLGAPGGGAAPGEKGASASMSAGMQGVSTFKPQQKAAEVMGQGDSGGGNLLSSLPSDIRHQIIAASLQGIR
jgi:hypothetical protein